MARPAIDPDLLAAMRAQVVRIAFLFEGLFGSHPLRLWTGIGDLAWNSQTWTGAGDLLGWGQVQETAEVKAVGMSVSLAGIDPASINAAFNYLRQGQLVNVYLATMTGGVIATPPYCFFQGRVDVPTIDDSPDTATISLVLENRMVDFERERVRFYDSPTQQGYYPGDLGFQHVPALQDQKLFWGVSD